LKKKKCCSAWNAHCRLAMNTKCGRKRERLVLCIARTCEKLYSEQYKRYNLSQGHHCGQAISETTIRTALVYYCMHNSLYTGTVHSVHRCWSTKYYQRAGSGHEPGAQEASTAWSIFNLINMFYFTSCKMLLYV
jgi:hypothetical protein